VSGWWLVLAFGVGVVVGEFALVCALALVSRIEPSVDVDEHAQRWNDLLDDEREPAPVVDLELARARARRLLRSDGTTRHGRRESR
jgi:hypothetical protein